MVAVVARLHVAVVVLTCFEFNEAMNRLRLQQPPTYTKVNDTANRYTVLCKQLTSFIKSTNEDVETKAQMQFEDDEALHRE